LPLGIERDDVAYIMSTFPIVERKDRAAYRTYRTRDLILSYYDAYATDRPWCPRHLARPGGEATAAKT